MKASPLRILFLTKYPEEGASSRYRVFQYINALSERGIESDVRPFYSSAGFQSVFGKGSTLKRTLAVLTGSMRRFLSVLTSGRYDLVYVQRELLPFGPPVLERWLSRHGGRLLFDYDDALFIGKPSAVSPLATQLRSTERILEIFALVDAVVAGNRWLKEQAEKRGATAYLLEVAEDTRRITLRPPHREMDAVALGWLGSRSTEKYLEGLTPVLERFFQRHPEARLIVVGGGQYTPEGLPVEHVPWSFESEVAQLHRFDIGLMPLPMEDWSKGKCGGKARTYMAAGIPAVVQDIGYNQELIRHGETGFLMPSDHETWLATLTRLTSDPELRQSVGERARTEVKERFNLDRIADQLAEILRKEAAAG